MNSILINIFSFFVICNVYSQDYITYDNYLQKARISIYTHKDTVTSLVYYEKAFSYVTNPFSEHLSEYHQLIRTQKLINTDQNILPNYYYLFKNTKDKDLFYENNCQLDEEPNSEILTNVKLRLLIDNLFEKDQAIDRNSVDKRESFIEIIEDFKLILEKYGFPTVDKIGLFVNKDGIIVSSPVHVLIIHAIQVRDAYF